MQRSDEADGSTARVPLGGDYWQTDPGTPIWGFADTHAHLMAHLAFGGRAFWGQPFDPAHTGPEAIEFALGSCAPIHGGLLNVNPEFGHPAAGGWPDFIVWPRFTTLVHQQAYLDWLYRTYQGGLRLIVGLAVNNELLANHTNPAEPHDDRSAIATQIRLGFSTDALRLPSSIACLTGRNSSPFSIAKRMAARPRTMAEPIRMR